jgi:sec-independent protein translocase protein TatA
MPNIGPLEIIIVLVIVLLIFGPKRLPDLGRSLGRGMREFKDSVTGKDKDEERPKIEEPRAESSPTVTPASADEEPARPASAPNPTNAS